MPPTAAGACYSLAVQLICKTTIGSKTGCDKLSKGRQQSKCAGVCRLLARQRTCLLATALGILPLGADIRPCGVMARLCQLEKMETDRVAAVIAATATTANRTTHAGLSFSERGLASLRLAVIG
jgi:hypothetical protein